MKGLCTEKFPSTDNLSEKKVHYPKKSSTFAPAFEPCDGELSKKDLI